MRYNALCMRLAVFGFHPGLSYAELLRTDPNAQIHGRSSAVFTSDVNPHLGGTVKIGRVVDEVRSTNPDTIKQHLYEHAADYFQEQQQSRNLGISVIDGQIPKYRQWCFNLKKQLRQNGLKVRIVLDDSQTLNAAQVRYNRLHHSPNVEILVAIGRDCTRIAVTEWVQDMDNYRQRDMERPCRDLKTGMLPPKLAQIMINLAGGSYVFDPFCGSGVVLQEALLMGKRAGGSDISNQMIDCSRRNLQWLQTGWAVAAPDYLETADARTIQLPDNVTSIVSEGYLGPLLKQPAQSASARSYADEADNLLQSTLARLQPQLPSQTPVVLAAPVWRTAAGMVTPTLVDAQSVTGYNRVRLPGVEHHDLRYIRDDQHVGRHLIVLEKQ